jgi:hypothetical protein
MVPNRRAGTRPAVKTSSRDACVTDAAAYAPTQDAAYTMSKQRMKPRAQCRVGFITAGRTTATRNAATKAERMT